MRVASLLLLPCVLGACAAEPPRHANRDNVENAVRHADLQKDRGSAPTGKALAANQ